MPRKCISPKYKYPYILEECPQSLKHAQQRIVYGKHKIEQTSSLQDFCLRLIDNPPKVSTAPKISTCTIANPEITYVLINGVLRYFTDEGVDRLNVWKE